MPHMWTKVETSESGLLHLLKNKMSLAELNKFLPEQSIPNIPVCWDVWQMGIWWQGRGGGSFNGCVTTFLVFAWPLPVWLCAKRFSTALHFFVYKIWGLLNCNLGIKNLSTQKSDVMFFTGLAVVIFFPPWEEGTVISSGFNKDSEQRESFLESGIWIWFTFFTIFIMNFTIFIMPWRMV